MIKINKRLDKLQKARQDMLITQKQIAEHLGISESYYCQLENGNRRMPLSLAINIAIFLKKDLNALFMPSDLAYCRDYYQADKKEVS